MPIETPEKLTDEQVVALQNQLSDEHRLAVAAVVGLTAVQVAQLFMSLRGESRKVFASTLREALPVMMNTYMPPVSQLSSSYYDNLRTVYSLSAPAPRRLPDFSPSPTRILETSRPLEIIEFAMQQQGYWIGQAMEGDFTPDKILKPTQQLVSQSLFDTSRQSIVINMDDDKVAASAPVSSTRSDGCVFCKLMSFNVGGEEVYFKPGNQPDWRSERKEGERGSVYHKGCNCINQPAFRNQVENRQPWFDEFEDDFYDARKELMDYNDSLTPEVINYTVERENSKGKIVRENKTRTIYKDASGKEVEKKSLTNKNIMSVVRKKTNSR